MDCRRFSFLVPLLLAGSPCRGDSASGETRQVYLLPKKLPPLSEPDPVGEKEMAVVEPLYEAVLKENEALIRRGRIAEATQRLLGVVPEASRTAAHNLYLGNMLFALDPKKSQALHLEALRQQPASSLTNLEAAFELQRAGQGKAACVLYERYLAKNPNHKVINSLWAHCLLEQGDTRRAIDAWKRADHPRKHVQIDETIFEVFGFRNPWAIRSELMGKIGASNAENSLAALLRHDLQWPINWWNSKPALDLARDDLAAFGGQAAPEVRESLTLFLDVAEGHASPSTELRARVREHLKQRGQKLPTQLLRGLVDFGTRGKIVSAQEAFDWLRPTLEKRLLSPAASADEAEFLAALALGHDAALFAKMDSLCWEKFKNRTCAESHFIAMAGSAALTLSDPGFKAALQAFPESSLLHLAALELTPKGGKQEQEAIRRVILADFHNLSTSNGALGDRASYGIKTFFSRLEQSLAPAPQ